MIGVAEYAAWIMVRRALIAIVKAQTPKELHDGAIMLVKVCNDKGRREALLSAIEKADEKYGVGRGKQ